MVPVTKVINEQNNNNQIFYVYHKYFISNISYFIDFTITTWIREKLLISFWIFL